jgi:hypothetical protein
VCRARGGPSPLSDPSEGPGHRAFGWRHRLSPAASPLPYLAHHHYRALPTHE